MDEHFGDIRPQCFDGAHSHDVLPAAGLFVRCEEGVAICCWQSGRCERVLVHDGDGGGFFAAGAGGAVGREEGVCGGDEVGTGEFLEG